MGVAKVRMRRWMSEHNLGDRIKNDDIRKGLGVATTEDKIKVNSLRWLGMCINRLLETGKEIESWKI